LKKLKKNTLAHKKKKIKMSKRKKKKKKRKLLKKNNTWNSTAQTATSISIIKLTHHTHKDN